LRNPADMTVCLFHSHVTDPCNIARRFL
jgi:hypothetical protein